MEDTLSEAPSSGAFQNIARTRTILDALASSGQEGLRMTDVVRITGLKKSVVHRALTGLTAYGLANYDAASAHFFLGDQIIAWMHRARDRFALAERIKPYLSALAADIEDTIYFSVLRGDVAACYGRAEGCSPVQFLTLYVGDTRPLGAGSGSLAIAAFLPDAHIERVIEAEACDAERKKYGITKQLLRESIAETRAAGYAVHGGLIAKDMTGMGVPVRNPDGAVVASFSVVALHTRVDVPRRDCIVRRLQAEAKTVERELAALLAEV